MNGGTLHLRALVIVLIIRFKTKIHVYRNCPGPLHDSAFSSTSVFGPAAGLHGATYVVDAEFSSHSLDQHNVVIDIGLAKHLLGKVLGELNYKNLDTLLVFKDTLTTTEFLARYIHERISQEVHENFQGSLKITLGESHVAWASYTAEVDQPE